MIRIPNHSSERLPRSGFALIATVSVMVLLVMVSMGVMSLSTSQIRSVKYDDYKSSVIDSDLYSALVAIWTVLVRTFGRGPLY